MRISLAIGVVALSLCAGAPPGLGATRDPAVPHILSLHDQAVMRDAWLLRRLETVLPALMEREGIDMWLLVAREYNEDPVVTASSTRCPSGAGAGSGSGWRKTPISTARRCASSTDVSNGCT